MLEILLREREEGGRGGNDHHLLIVPKDLEVSKELWETLNDS